ncbi:MAG TPA: hypothetical protein VFG38_11675 [Pseudomonadales bacterium]|nr:hypothetical protein [Pseudomonadales bacterium]
MKIASIVVAALGAIVVGYLAYAALIVNPRVMQELRDDPNGERARKAMLITLPSGRTIPVNFLREGNVVYAGADGRWWHELRGAGGRVQLLVRGETLTGIGRAIEDQPEHRADVFSRLRPTAPKFTGTLVQIDLDPLAQPL